MRQAQPAGAAWHPTQSPHSPGAAVAPGSASRPATGAEAPGGRLSIGGPQ